MYANSFSLSPLTAIVFCLDSIGLKSINELSSCRKSKFIKERVDPVSTKNLFKTVMFFILSDGVIVQFIKCLSYFLTETRLV